MTTEIVERVLRSRPYHDVDPAPGHRLATEELVHARNADDAVKRVKRRLHQAVGAFRRESPGDPLAATRASWTGDLGAPEFRDACAAVLATHASTRERLSDLPAFFGPLWEVTGRPARLLDLGCGLGPLALPWMGLDATATYHAVDADRRPLATVEAYMELVGRPHEIEALDVIAEVPDAPADVALLLKLVTTLDRQDSAAAARVLGRLAAPHAVVSFTRRSLGGRSRGMERTYRDRLDRLVADVPRVRSVTERSAPSELVFVLELGPIDG
jgi:16S rRNA (guanine(1405)-N(7))-methyltransferase